MKIKNNVLIFSCCICSILLIGCSDDVGGLDAGADADGDGGRDADGDHDSTPDGDVESTPDSDEPFDADVISDADGSDSGPEIDPNPDCDPLTPTVCALPWPSSLFLVPDSSRDTGYTIALGETSLPENTSHVHPAPSLLSRFDGYTVGTSIIGHFPELDASGLPGELDIERSIDDDSPILLLEITDEGARRVPCWAEIDAYAESDEEALLFVRPAEILKHRTQYIVAFRDLVDRTGRSIPPSPAFRLLREGLAEGHSVLGPRVDRFEELFDALDEAGIERESLILAWDFVTSSSSAAHGDMLSIRDQAYDLVGAEGPELTIGSVEVRTPEEDSRISHRIHGTFSVPDFTEERSIEGTTGYMIHRDSSGEPAPNGWVDRDFVAVIPRDNGTGQPLELMEYGHGLLGTYQQVFGGHNAQVAYDHGLIFFGATLTGFGGDDLATIVSALSDPSLLTMFTERIHQGVVEYLLLARAMGARFSSLPEIAALEVTIDGGRLYYSGISQGGIYGATVMALSLDITTGHLGVPGSNYNLLLERSVDFSPYLAILDIFYPDRLDQPLILEAAANLWQTTDPVSYYRHITAEPFPDTPVHHVLLAQAQYDWQVAPLSNEIATRSGLGVALMANYGREVALVDPTSYPHSGSALVSYSFGDPWAPPGNTPPPETENGDPHQKPRTYDHHNRQMIHFLRTGEVIDVCGGDECTPE